MIVEVGPCVANVVPLFSVVPCHVQGGDKASKSLEGHRFDSSCLVASMCSGGVIVEAVRPCDQWRGGFICLVHQFAANSGGLGIQVCIVGGVNAIVGNVDKLSGWWLVPTTWDFGAC